MGQGELRTAASVIQGLASMKRSKVQLEPYMLGKVGEREGFRWKNSLITIFAGYLIENLCVRANTLGNWYRSVRPDRAIILQG